jgi:hypothetical protein
MQKFEVVVSNIGTIPCKTMSDAEETYWDYIAQSKNDNGRASGESVVLCVDGEPVKEYYPNSEEE